MRVKLQEWISAQTIKDEMLWKGAFGDQVSFVRDRLSALVCGDIEREYMECCCDHTHVISEHHSKSISLPVYEIERPGLKLILRNNFYNWKLSVISDKPIEADFTGLFITSPPTEPDYTGDSLHPVYFEGFPTDLIFGYYDTSDKKKWSAEIHDDYFLMAVIFLIMRSLGTIKPQVYSTRAEHQVRLAKDHEKFEKWMAKERVKKADEKAQTK